MKLGIDDYLLKDDLTPENILSFLQEHLQSVAEEQENLPVSSEELARLGKEKLREDFFTSFQKSDMAEEELLHMAKRAGLPETFRFAAACRISLRGWQLRRQQFSPDDLASFQQAFIEMCQTILGHQQPELLGQSFPVRPDDGAWGILLFFPHAVSRASVLQQLQALGQKIQVLIRRYFDLQSVLVLTAPQVCWLALHKAWQAVDARSESVFYLPHGMFHLEDLPVLQASAPFAADLPAGELCRSLEQIPLTKQARRALVHERFAGQDEVELAALDEAEALPPFLAALHTALDAARSASRLHPSVRQAMAILEAHYRRISRRQRSRHRSISIRRISRHYSRRMSDRDSANIWQHGALMPSSDVFAAAQDASKTLLQPRALTIIRTSAACSRISSGRRRRNTV